MNGVFIKIKSVEELEFVSSLLKKLRIQSKIITIEELEDMGLSKLMKAADRTKKVDRSATIRKLQS